MSSFRLLNEKDLDVYYEVLHAGYQSIKDLPITFDAVSAGKEQVLIWLKNNPAYGLFLEGRLISAVSVRLPWGPNPGPEVAPHIGWFVTHPEYKRQDYGKKLFFLVESNILKEQLKAPFVTLGTASNHPWLKEMYEKIGFRHYSTVQLPGKKHQTLYLKKNLV